MSPMTALTPEEIAELRERVRAEIVAMVANALNEELSDAYDCTRVWQAWGVGTMSERDFVPVLDRVDLIASSIVAPVLDFVDRHGLLTAAAEENSALRARVAELEAALRRTETIARARVICDDNRYAVLRDLLAALSAQPSDDGWRAMESIGGWFGLTYASYAVIPRLALEAQPDEWQHRFVRLMDEAEGRGLVTPKYLVFRDDPDFCSVERQDEADERSPVESVTVLREDPWANYRRGDYSAVLAEQRSRCGLTPAQPTTPDDRDTAAALRESAAEKHAKADAATGPEKVHLRADAFSDEFEAMVREDEDARGGQE